MSLYNGLYELLEEARSQDHLLLDLRAEITELRLSMDEMAAENRRLKQSVEARSSTEFALRHSTRTRFEDTP